MAVTGAIIAVAAGTAVYTASAAHDEKKHQENLQNRATRDLKRQKELIPKAPQYVDRDRQRRVRTGQSLGLASTSLTGPLGLTNDPNGQRKTLLGS